MQTINLHNVVLIESQYIPPITFFSLLYRTECQHLIIEAFENYQKGSYRNRCHIAHSTGKQMLSVPLKGGKNERQPIREVQIAYDINWQKQHWKSIRTAYGSAPYWEYYAPMFEPFFSQRYQFLFDLNFDIIQVFFTILKINKNIKISLSSKYDKFITEGYDFRNSLSPKKEGESQVMAYPQLFQEKNGFLSDLSILDLVFCTGPRAVEILQKSGKI